MLPFQPLFRFACTALPQSALPTDAIRRAFHSFIHCRYLPACHCGELNHLLESIAVSSIADSLTVNRHVGAASFPTSVELSSRRRL
ncbi:unnamed protein product [Vitrella brassicaformis CCMP3155]|uniref:Uncharacterized protein n=1 Tax=Vitrella brassicaformis (strain CCMP3155) TaxID=1169540 RepID=A0A0G4FPD3_VITBC|nr:unnamed protein product [Vitrella brassicaformis CCMP3155]|eukprot:CEM15865.1 unnamed protein product [Vitrella brassicaformis CCMP3155]